MRANLRRSPMLAVLLAGLVLSCRRNEPDAQEQGIAAQNQAPSVLLVRRDSPGMGLSYMAPASFDILSDTNGLLALAPVGQLNRRAILPLRILKVKGPIKRTYPKRLFDTPRVLEIDGISVDTYKEATNAGFIRVYRSYVMVQGAFYDVTLATLAGDTNMTIHTFVRMAKSIRPNLGEAK